MDGGAAGAEGGSEAGDFDGYHFDNCNISIGVGVIIIIIWVIIISIIVVVVGDSVSVVDTTASGSTKAGEPVG